VERKPIQPRYQDPGAATMVLGVRDLDSVVARLKSAGSPIVTTGAEPVKVAEGRAILVKDPDGFYVELVERPGPAGASNFVDVGFMFTVSDTDRMVRVFKDALGFEFTKGQFQSDRARLKLMGMSKAQFKESATLVPGTPFHVSLLEFKGIDRKPVESRPQDPGTPVFRLVARDADAAIQDVAAAGVKVASHNGEAISLKGGTNTLRAGITSFPDNLYVQLIHNTPNP